MKEVERVIQGNYPIVFYDGDCGFCSHSVQFVLKNRRKEVFFIPLQSTNAKLVIEDKARQGHEIISMNTMYLFHKRKIQKESTAVLNVCRYLKFPYPIFFYLGSIVPRFLRDSIYRAIAKRRFQIAHPSCLLPTVEERAFFLK